MKADIAVLRCALLLALGTPASAASTNTCFSVDPKMYRYLSHQEVDAFETLTRRLCDGVAAGKYSSEVAESYAASRLYRDAMCNGKTVDDAFWRNHLELYPPPPIAYEFCRITDETPKEIRKGIERLDFEIRCAKADERFAQWFVPNLASIREIRDAIRSVCQEVRDGKLDVASARYRLSREKEKSGIARFLIKDISEEVSTTLRKLSQYILGLIGLIATVVGILVGIRTLMPRDADGASKKIRRPRTRR